MKSSAAFVLFLTAAALSGQPCAPAATRLCLSGQRFSVEVRWTDFQGNTGAGQAVPLTSDTGYFWFFGPTNVELVVKVLDGRGLNGHFWVFYGALSNVEYEMTVQDLRPGTSRSTTTRPAGSPARGTRWRSLLTRSRSPNARAASVSDRRLAESSIAPAAPDAAAASAPQRRARRRSPRTALCLAGGRFRVTAAWKDFEDNTGVGHAVALTSDTGYFWFFGSSNVEVVVKALDGAG